MTEYEITVNALIYEQERAEKVDVLSEDRGVNRSELVRQLIDEEFERQDVKLEEYENDEGNESIVETYDTEGDHTLNKDDLKQLAGEAKEINVHHVQYGDMPSGSDAVLLIASMTRYRTDQANVLDIQQICEQVGLDSDYYLDTMPRKVIKTLDKRYTEDEDDNNGASDERVVKLAVNACVDNIVDLDENISGLYSAYTDIDQNDRWDYYVKANARTDEFVLSVLEEIDDRKHPYLDELDWYDNLDEVIQWFKQDGEDWADNEKVMKLVKEEIESWLVEQEETEETEETEDDTQEEENETEEGGYLDQLDQAEVQEEYEEKDDYYSKEDRLENHEKMRQQNQR
jgi:hypothetical protein